MTSNTDKLSLNYNIFQNFIGFSKKNQLTIVNFESRRVMLKCSFSDNINNFILDHLNNILFILLENGNLEIISPKVTEQNKEISVCECNNI